MKKQRKKILFTIVYAIFMSIKLFGNESAVVNDSNTQQKDSFIITKTGEIYDEDEIDAFISFMMEEQQYYISLDGNHVISDFIKIQEDENLIITKIGKRSFRLSGQSATRIMKDFKKALKALSDRDRERVKDILEL